MSPFISSLSLSIFIHLVMWSQAEEPRVHHRTQVNGVTFQGMSRYAFLQTNWRNPVTHIATDTQSLDRILVSTKTSISLLNWREDGEELLVGSLTESGFANGRGGQARFKWINSFALFNYSKVYVVDIEAHCIRAFERPENNVVPFIGQCNQTGGDYSGLKLIATDQVDGVIYFTTNGAKIYKKTGNHLSGPELIGERPGSLEYEGILLDENHRSIYLTTYPGEIMKFDVMSRRFSDITYSLSKGHRDGLRVDALFNTPKSLVLVNKNTLLVGDVENHVIRVVDLKESGAVSTICDRNNGDSQDPKFGKINECVIEWPTALLYSPERKAVFVGSGSYILDLQLKFVDDDYESPIFRPNVNGAEFGKASLFYEFDVDPDQHVTTTHIEADISSPSRVVLSTTTTITTIDMLTMEMSHLVGRLDVAAYKEGQGPKAKFQSITSFAQLNRSALLAVDSNSNCIRMVERVTAITSPFFGTCKTDGEAGATFVRLNQIATSVDKTQIFFTSGPSLYKLNMADATAQLLNGHSSDRTYVAMHVNKETGVMYFATNYDRIVKYDPDDAYRHTPVSLRAEVGYKDGQLLLAQFDFPEGLTMIDRHTLLVADQNNRVVRVVDLPREKVSSICLKHSFDPPTTGVVSTCKISKPSSIAYLPEFSIVMVGTNPHLYTINVNKGNTAQHKPLHIPKVNGVPFRRVTPFYQFPTNERGKITHMEEDLLSPDHLLISTTKSVSRIHLDTFDRQVLLETSQVTTTARRFPSINVFSQLNENELVLASFTCLPKFYRGNSSFSVFHGNCNHGDSEKGINQMVLSRKTGLLYFANGSTIYSKVVDGGSVYKIGSRPGSVQYESMQMNPKGNMIYLVTYYGLLVSLDLRTRKFKDIITQFTPGHRDGLLHEAQFSSPEGLAVINKHTVLVADLQNHMVRVVDLSSPGRVSSICEENTYGLVKEGSISGCLINQPTALLHLPRRQAVFVGALPDLYIMSLIDYVTESAEVIYRTEVNKQSFDKVKRFQKLNFGPGVDERITHMEVDLNSANRILVSTTTSIFVLNLDTGARTNQLGITGSSGHQDGAGTNARFKRISSFAQLNQLAVVVADSGARCMRLFNIVDYSLSLYYGECNHRGVMDPTYKPVDLMTIDRRRDYLYFSNGATVYQKRTQRRKVDTIGTKQGEIRFESMQMDESHNILYLITYHGLLVKLEINQKVFTEITSRFAPGYHDGFFHEAQFSTARGMALLNSKTLMVADTPNNVVRIVDLSSTERVSSICAENKYNVERKGNIKECLLHRPSSILHIPERSMILVGTSPNIFVIEPKEDNAVVRGSHTYRARVNRLKFEDVIPSYDFEEIFDYSMRILVTHLEEDKLTPSRVIISTTRTISVLDLNTDEHTIIAGNISEAGYVEGNGTQARFIYITCFSQLHSGDLLVVERASSCIRYINRSSQRTSPLYGRCRGAGKYGDVLKTMERLEINKGNDTLYISNGNSLYQLVYATDNQPELLGTKRDVKYFEDMRLDSTGSYLYLATNYDQLIKFDLAKKDFRRVSSENIPGHLDGSLKEVLFHSPASLTFANDETMLVADSINRVVRVVDLSKKRRVSSICQNKNLEEAREDNIQKCVIGQPSALVYLPHHSAVFIAGSETFFLMDVTVNKVTVNGTYIHRDVVNKVQFGDVELFHKFAETRIVPDSYEETTHMELDLQDTSKVLVSTTGSISVFDLETHSRAILVGDIAEKGHIDGVGIDARFESISHFAQLSEHSLVVVDSGANCVRAVNRTTAATSIAFGQCRDSGRLDDILDSVQKISVDRSRARVYVTNHGSIYKFRIGKLKLMGIKEGVGRYNAMQLDSAGAYLYLVTFYDQLLKFNLEKKIFSEVTAQTTAGHQDGPLSEALFFAPRSLAFLNKETLLVADSFNKVIRVVDLSERGRVSSICSYSPSATVQLGSIRVCSLPSSNAVLYVPNMAAVLVGTDPDLYILRLLKTGPKSFIQNGGLLLTAGSTVGYAFVCLVLLYSYYS